MTWVIIGGFLLIFFCWLLFAPLFLHINTSEQDFSVGLKGIFKLSIIPNETEILFLQISIFFYRFNFYPLKKKEKKKKAKPKRKKKKKKGPAFKTILLILKITWNVIRSFKLKKLYLNIDSNDGVTNAFLIPVFANLHRNKINLNINYVGDLEMIINIENNIFRMLVVTIKTYLHHKKLL